jgi:hypothetical protein
VQKHAEILATLRKRRARTFQVHSPHDAVQIARNAFKCPLTLRIAALLADAETNSIDVGYEFVKVGLH